MTTHIMTMKEISDGRYLCECPECGRKQIFDIDPFGLIVLAVGDLSVNHSCSTSGMTIDKVELKDPALEQFEAWAEEHGL